MRRSFAVLLATLLAAACGGSGTGQVKVSLTSTPDEVSGVDQVNVTFDEIRAHVARADDSAPDAGDAEGSGWMVLCSDEKTMDLLSLPQGVFTPLCSRVVADGGTEELAVEVPAGRISQVRLHMVRAELVLNDGTTANVTVPSGTTSGLKINVQESVPQGGTLQIKLEFDAAQSIHRTGEGEYVMEPVIRVVR
jgi:uncharacterized protein DUF4382